MAAFSGCIRIVDILRAANLKGIGPDVIDKEKRMALEIAH